MAIKSNNLQNQVINYKMIILINNFMNYNYVNYIFQNGGATVECEAGQKCHVMIPNQCVNPPCQALGLCEG